MSAEWMARHVEQGRREAARPDSPRLEAMVEIARCLRWFGPGLTEEQATGRLVALVDTSSEVENAYISGVVAYVYGGQVLAIEEVAHGGYRNAETYFFVATTENIEAVYNDMRAVAAECLRRVPSMTDQTLGKNVFDAVRSWIYAMDHGLPIENLGWSDKTPVTSTRADLALVKSSVGDMTRVHWDDVGTSWRETLTDTQEA